MEGKCLARVHRSVGKPRSEVGVPENQARTKDTGWGTVEQVVLSMVKSQNSL